MRLLLPTASDRVDLHEVYAHRGDRPWVRANMVASLDGSAVKDGRSGGLGGPADKEVFGVLRSLCDAVLVGAGTARAEGYRAPRAKEADAERRRAAGQRPAPVLVLVTRRLDLDPASALFAGDGAQRTIVVTSGSSDRAARDRLAEIADLVVAGDDQVDVAAALDELAGRGLTRVLCEGGPSLLGDVAAAGRLDELCLTISPQLVGGDGPRVAHGPDLDVDLSPASLLEADGVLLARYVRGEE
jgi:riboflavin-specific deaminase-like protein